MSKVRQLLCYLAHHSYEPIDAISWDDFPLVMIRCKHCKTRAVMKCPEQETVEQWASK